MVHILCLVFYNSAGISTVINGNELYVINKSSQKTIYIVISKNHFLKVLIGFHRLVLTRIACAARRSERDWRDETLVKETEIFRYENRIGLLIATR